MGNYFGVFAAHDLAECWQVQPSTQCVWRLVFSPDGSLLAWNGEQREIYVATVASGYILYQLDGTHLSNCIAFSADGHQLLTDGNSFDLFVYEALTGEARQSLTGHASNLMSLVTSPTSGVVASSDNIGVVKLWAGDSGVLLATTQLSRPYLGMNIANARGLTDGQRKALLALGAVDETGQ
jgi:WD40 repeat protein